MKNIKLKSILILFILLLLIFIFLNIFTSVLEIKKSAEKSIANQTLKFAKVTANQIDTEAYKRFLKNPTENQDYRDIKHFLEDIRERTGALYIYTLAIDNPKVAKVMIAAGSNGVNSIPIGDVCTTPEQQVKLAYGGHPFYTEIIKDSIYGDYLSVGTPIMDKDDTIIGYLSYDVSADAIDDISGKVLKESTANFVFNGVFVVILLAFFFIMQRWYQKELVKEVGDTEGTYQMEFQSLLASVHSLRHDFSNHIQVVYGLLKLAEHDKALEYLTALSKEIHSITSINLNINNPGLSVLLETKKLSAQNYNIDITFDISNDSFNAIKTTDLIKILSNVIDNAIEATIKLPEKERVVKIKCKVDGNTYIFEVTNTGPMIPPKTQEHMFKSGFSTKQVEKGRSRGQGLFIVKDLISKYDGDICINSNENETSVIMRIPSVSEREKK